MKFLSHLLIAAVLLAGCAEAFAVPVTVASLLIDRSTTGAGTAVQLGGISRTYFAFGTTSSGIGACDVKIQVSNNNSSFIDLGTISLTLGTAQVADGLATAAPWRYVRGNVSAISGTGAVCSLMVGSTGE